eukprot:354195-Chlamydomonas_euryale.AAC.2
MAAAGAKAQQQPHTPWFRTGGTCTAKAATNTDYHSAAKRSCLQNPAGKTQLAKGFAFKIQLAERHMAKHCLLSGFSGDYQCRATST